MTDAKRYCPYGRWPSPVSAGLLAGDRKLRDVAWDPDSGTLVWLEGRGDRGMLLAQGPAGDAPRELVREIDVRGEVGYGGGDFTVHGGRVFFAERRTGRLWAQSLVAGEARPITPAFGKAAAPAVSPDGRWIAYVHHDPGTGEDRLGVVDVEGRRWPQILHQGADFYMQPRWGVTGGATFLYVICWQHPHMPWESSTLYRAAVQQTPDALPQIGELQALAGGDGVSVFQPEPSPGGEAVYVISDESGFWHLWRIDLASGEHSQVTHGEAEYGLPAWSQGLRSYGLTGDGRRAVCCRNQNGSSRLIGVDLGSGDEEALPGLAAYTYLEQIAVCPQTGRVACIASATTTPPRVLVVDPEIPAARVAARASAESVPPAALASCEPVTWESRGGEPVHGLFYRPHSNAVVPVPGRPPPLILFVHGGPTDQVHAAWDPRSQFFATRGYAVLCPNYRGSTGYGRAYRDRLRGGWGILDVEDAVTGARAMAARGEADAERSIIAGGSAGGYTVWQALIHEPDAFAAGLCFYGVADLFALARDTHKLEQHYTDSLVGPLPVAAVSYRERSPVFHAERIRRPVAVFQGSEDRVVPKSQGDAMVAALRQNGVPHVYHVYDGEGHGFRKPETLDHFYRAMEEFLLRYVIYA